MPKRNPIVTPKSKIKNAIRQVWLRSRERAAALKREHYTCERCGVKQSKARGKEVVVNVHHKNGIDWDGITEDIRKRVLQTPDAYEVLCEDCHGKEHESNLAESRKEFLKELKTFRKSSGKN
jgi:5-methylcytosine-specific restriction endonuclease McrA